MFNSILLNFKVPRLVGFDQFDKKIWPGAGFSECICSEKRKGDIRLTDTTNGSLNATKKSFDCFFFLLKRESTHVGNQLEHFLG